MTDQRSRYGIYWASDMTQTVEAPSAFDALKQYLGVQAQTAVMRSCGPDWASAHLTAEGRLVYITAQKLAGVN